VLVPTDFSEPANQALRFAVEEATLHQAKVTLLHVQAPTAGTEVYYVTGTPAFDPATGVDPMVAHQLAPCGPF
jgi:nucleotide-binding universal stress UspA family protein